MSDTEIYIASDEKQQLEVPNPAAFYYKLTLALDVLVVIFGFISAWVPWVMKDLAVGMRAYAMPFRTCIEKTFSEINEETCMDNDFLNPKGVPLTGGNSACHAYVLTTIAMVFISVILGAILIIILIYVLKCLQKLKIWVALIAEVCLVIVCIAAHLAWIFFLIYGETTCVEGSIFPVHGYSYGFILYIFVSAFSITDVVTGAIGFLKLRNYQDMQKAWEKQPDEMPHFADAIAYDSTMPGAAPPTPAYVHASPQ